MATSNVVLSSALPSDFLSIARLDIKVFYNEEFSTVAFGPQRGSEASIARRASVYAQKPKTEGERVKILKATIRNKNGEDEIVGVAAWSFITGSETKGDEKGGAPKTLDIGIEKEKAAPADEEIDNEKWGPGANVKLCNDLFTGADKHMLESTEGKDFAKLNVLVVSQEYQRMGIGTKLLKEGLDEADHLGLQAVLGASKYGSGLYAKHGFTVFAKTETNLWEYEGGEGMGVDVHLVMHRPAQKRQITV